MFAFKYKNMKTGIMINIKIINVFALIFLLVVYGCKKDALVGPAGPIGPTGATGPAGNANVDEYDFVTSSNDWVQSGNSWSAVYSSVTVNKTDAIMVSVSNGGSTPSYIALPYINPTTEVQTYFSNTLNTITIGMNNPFNSNPISNPGSVTFKIVVIPSTHRLANINTFSFGEVKAAYHLKGK